MIRKILGFLLVILALSILYYKNTVNAEAQENIQSKIQYELNDGIIDSTRIDLFNVNTNADNTLVIFLPFEIKEIKNNNSNYYTSIGRIGNFSIIQVYINKKDERQNNISLKCSINKDDINDSENGLKVLSYPMETSITVPKLSNEDVSKYNGALENIINPIMITEFNEVNVLFDNNYEVISPGKKPDKVSKNELRIMALNSTYNQYEILFQNVQSENKNMIFSVIKSVIATLIGMASTFIALGYIPNRKFKIIIIAYAIIILMLIVVSLFFMPSMQDFLINIPGYVINIISFVVWWHFIRKMRGQPQNV